MPLPTASTPKSKRGKLNRPSSDNESRGLKIDPESKQLIYTDNSNDGYIDTDLESESPFNIIEELSFNRPLYNCKRSSLDDNSKQFTLYSVPNMVLISAARLCPLCDGDTEPSVCLVLTCSIYHGISVISSLPSFKGLIEIHREVNSLGGEVDGGKLSEANSILTKTEISEPSLNDSGSHRKNLWMPRYIYDGLNGVSSVLAMPASIVGVLAVIIAMGKQDEKNIHPQYKKEMQRVTEVFLSRIKLRYEIGNVLIGWLKGE